MQILADNNMTGVDETFGQHGELRRFDGRALKPGTLGDADVLLVRSVTDVNADLLAGSHVRFVGTATIGTDHLDTHWLEQQGIHWASAPGCNADAAAQYTLGMMYLASRRLERQLADQEIAIVGHGNVGSRVHRLLNALGARVIVCDPPLAEAGQLDSVPLDDALNADIVTLHVPLERQGPHPTHHMINRETLAQMRPGALLINAARGDVIHEAALITALKQARLYAALDVWPSEPRIEETLLDATTVASPHVAGFSVEGKKRGTQMIYDAFTSWLGVAAPATAENTKAEPLDIPWPEAPATHINESLADAVILATHVEEDDVRMRHVKPGTAATFDPLRRAHAPRHEFARLCLSPPLDAVRQGLKGLGFKVT